MFEVNRGGWRRREKHAGCAEDPTQEGSARLRAQTASVPQSGQCYCVPGPARVAATRGAPCTGVKQVGGGRRETGARKAEGKAQMAPRAGTGGGVVNSWVLVGGQIDTEAPAFGDPFRLPREHSRVTPVTESTPALGRETVG